MGKELSGNWFKRFDCLLVCAVLTALLLNGCAKDGGTCASSSGETTRQVRNVSAFNQIELNNNVNLILTTDSIGPLVVEAGKNLLGGITTEVQEGHLIISNNNKCNWLRDYSKPVNIYISVQKIWKIKYNSIGTITTKGALKLDSLSVEVWGGSGTIDLTLDIKKGNFSLGMGTVDFKLRGESPVTSVYASDYGFYDGRELQTEYTYITSVGSNDCYVKSSHVLEATIKSIGNIYYTGNPTDIKTNITGAGKLIRY